MDARIRGKKCGQVMFKPHPSCTHRAMASTFEMKAVPVL